MALFLYMNLLNGTTQDLVAYGVIFLLGVFVKSRVQWGKTNSDALETLTADYQAIKALYESKCDEIKRRNDQLQEMGRQVLELRARVRSYENFISSRAPETDRLVKAIAEKVGATTDEVVLAYDAAHSQAKTVEGGHDGISSL